VLNQANGRRIYFAGWTVFLFNRFPETLPDGLTPVHPGEIIKETSCRLPAYPAAAKALGVTRQMLHDILGERRPLSAVRCLKLSSLFGSTPEFWMRLQAYDLKKAEQSKKVMQRISRIVPLKLVEEVQV
jgi:addiction module HigA family antidote